MCYFNWIFRLNTHLFVFTKKRRVCEQLLSDGHFVVFLMGGYKYPVCFTIRRKASIWPITGMNYVLVQNYLVIWSRAPSKSPPFPLKLFSPWAHIYLSQNPSTIRVLFVGLHASYMNLLKEDNYHPQIFHKSLDIIAMQWNLRLWIQFSKIGIWVFFWA